MLTTTMDLQRMMEEAAEVEASEEEAVAMIAGLVAEAVLVHLEEADASSAAKKVISRESVPTLIQEAQEVAEQEEDEHVSSATKKAIRQESVQTPTLTMMELVGAEAEDVVVL